jgi:hypothetical protein
MGFEPMSRPFTGLILSSRRNSLLHQSSAKLVACSLPVKVIAATYLNFESSFTTFISTQVGSQFNDLYISPALAKVDVTILANSLSRIS